MGLYPSIPPQTDLSALKEALENKSVKKMPTKNLIKIAGFILKRNLFEFHNKVFQKISGTAIGTKFAPPYACIYMDRVKQVLLEKHHNYNHYSGLGTLMIFFLIWAHEKEELKKFMEKFNNFTRNLRFM